MKKIIIIIIGTFLSAPLICHEATAQQAILKAAENAKEKALDEKINELKKLTNTIKENEKTIKQLKMKKNNAINEQSIEESTICQQYLAEKSILDEKYDTLRKNTKQQYGKLVGGLTQQIENLNYSSTFDKEKAAEILLVINDLKKISISLETKNSAENLPKKDCNEKSTEPKEIADEFMIDASDDENTIENKTQFTAAQARQYLGQNSQQFRDYFFGSSSKKE